MASCKGRNRMGTPCRAVEALVAANGFCRMHDPDLVAERKLQSLKGGSTTARRFRKAGITPEDLGPLESPADAQRWLQTIAEAVGERRLTHSEGSAMTRSVSEWIKARDLHVREERLADLEREVKRLRKMKVAS